MDKPIDFEIAMKELEIVVSELDGEVKLEQALNLFEQGMKLSKQCEDFLKGAEQKIEMLKRGQDGSLVAVAVVGDTIEAVSVAGSAAPVRTEKREKAAALRVDKSDAADAVDGGADKVETEKESTKRKKSVVTGESETVVKESEVQLSFFGGEAIAPV
jgi:exodeoxyribonuclease VII small subunit